MAGRSHNPAVFNIEDAIIDDRMLAGTDVELMSGTGREDITITGREDITIGGCDINSDMPKVLLLNYRIESGWKDQK